MVMCKKVKIVCREKIYKKTYTLEEKLMAIESERKKVVVEKKNITELPKK